MHTDRALHQRLASLEQSLRRTQRTNRALTSVVALLAASAGWMVLSGFGVEPSEIPKELRARAFILEDEDHKVYGEFRLDDDKPTLRMLDDRGSVRVKLSTVCQSGGAGLELCDDSGVPRFQAGTKTEGPFVGLYDGQGKLRGQFGIDESIESVGLNLFSGDGSPRIALLTHGQQTSLEMRDANSRPRLAIDVRDGDAIFKVSDKDGKLRAALGSCEWPAEQNIEMPEGTLVVYDREGKPAWQTR